MDEAELNQLSTQDLIDYLHTAVSEDDLLFVLYWISRLKEKGVISPALRSHSWKGTSPLYQAVTRAHSATREVLFQTLLSSIAHQSTTEPTLFEGNIRGAEHWAESVLTAWRKDCATSVETGKALLALPVKEAAEWIDENLPLHPNPDALTGYKQLAPPPLSPFASRCTLRSTSTTPNPPQPLLSPTLPPSSIDDSPPCRLHLGSFPYDVEDAAIERLLRSTQVPIHFLKIARPKKGRVNVFFSVESKKDMLECASVLDGQELHSNILFVERAIAPNPEHLYYHFVVPHLPKFYNAIDVQRLARPSRGGPFGRSVGYDSEGNWVGLGRVESSEGAQEIIEYLQARGYEGAFWARDPAPSLLPVPPSLPPSFEIFDEPVLNPRKRSRSDSETLTSSTSTSRQTSGTWLSPSLDSRPTSRSPSRSISPFPLSSNSTAVTTSHSPSDPPLPSAPFPTGSFDFSPSLPRRPTSPFSHSYEEAFLPINFSKVRPALDAAKAGEGYERLRSKRRKIG